MEEASLDVLTKALKDDVKRKQAVEGFAQSARAWAPLPGAPSADDAYARAKAYGAQVMDALVAELSDLTRPEGRYVSVWVAAATRP